MASLTSGTSSGEFSIGELISTSLSIFRGGFLKFIGLAAITVVPWVVILIVFGTAAVTPGAANAGALGTVALVLGFVTFVLSLTIQGALIFGAFTEMRGRDFSIGEALSKGLSRFLPLLGVAIVSSIVMGIGFILLIVPGFMALCMLYVCTAACVVEQKGVLDSLARSRELTKGYRWKIFGLVLIVGVVAVIVNAIVGALVRAIAGPIVAGLVQEVVQIFVTAYGGILVALIYYRLRSIKEGIDIDRIAEVFA